MQIAATPQRSLRSTRTFASVLSTRAPDAPSGWPIAIAPPRVLTIVGVDPPGVEAGQRLHRERLVELDRSDVGPADAGRGEGALGRLDRCDPEPLRLERGRTAARDPGERRDSDRGVLRRDQERCRAVVERGRVAGGDRPVGTERGLEPGQGLGTRVGSDTLVAVQAVARQHQVVVEAVRPGLGGAPVRRHGERVLPLPADPECVGQLLVALAQGGGPLLRHPLVDQAPAESGRHQGLVAGREGTCRLRQHPRCPAHRLDPARDHDLGVAGLDETGRVHRRLEAASAEPVDGHAGDADRQTGQQDGHPADVAVVLARAVRAAEDHVGDPRRVDLGRAVEQAAHDRRREVVGPAAGEGAGVPAERRADPGVEEGMAHVGPVGLEPTTHGLKVHCSAN